MRSVDTTNAVRGEAAILEDLGLAGQTENEQIIRQLRRRLWRFRDQWQPQDREAMDRADRLLGDRP